MKTFVGAKIHGIRVTGGSINYNGSVSIDKRLMEAAGIVPYQQLYITNLMNGARWVTYALPSDEVGCFTLNGAAARLGVVDDSCIVMTYIQAEEFKPFTVVFCNEKNEIRNLLQYGD